MALRVLREVSMTPCASSNSRYAPSETPAQPMQPERAPRRTITLDIPEPLIDWLDKQANSLTISRSAFVRMMITRAMSAQS